MSSLLISGKIALKMQTVKKPKRTKGEATSKMTPEHKIRWKLLFLQWISFLHLASSLFNYYTV